MARILFVGSPLIGFDAYGGMATQVFCTRDALRRLGHEVVCHNPWLAVPPGELDIVHLFVANNETLELALRLRRRVAHMVVSPIIDHSFSPRLICLANRIACCLPKLSFHLLSAERICRIADVCIARSDAESAILKRGFKIPPSRIAVLPLGVDQEAAAAMPHAFRRLYGDEEFALFVGAIGNPVKNLLRLIRVLGPTGIPLFVVGPVWDTAYAKACYREAEGFPNIKVLGPLPRHLLLSAYSAAKVLVLPSLQEGVGIVALEAGLAGAQVVITRRGGPPFYFREYARYVNPRSSRSILRAVRASMDEPRNDWLRNFLRQHPSWERVGQLHHKLYNSLMAGQAPTVGWRAGRPEFAGARSASTQETAQPGQPEEESAR